jgi:hypothetical protein
MPELTKDEVLSMKMNLDIPKLMQQVVLNVTMKRTQQAMIRVRIAALLIRIAAWIGGFGGVTIERDTRNATH